MTEGFPVGARIKALRLQQGISQRELARRAQLTNGNLSQIEQGKISPSLATLEKLLGALNLALDAFFSPSDSPLNPITPLAQWALTASPGGLRRSMGLEAVLPQGQLIRQVLAPGGAWQGTENAGAPWLLGTLLQGQLDIRLEGVVHHLSPGDGFSFSARARFSFINSSNTTAEWLMVYLHADRANAPSGKLGS